MILINTKNENDNSKIRKTKSPFRLRKKKCITDYGRIEIDGIEYEVLWDAENSNSNYYLSINDVWYTSNNPFDSTYKTKN